MTAVLKHELRLYFHSLTAYVFGAGLLLAVPCSTTSRRPSAILNMY